MAVVVLKTKLAVPPVPSSWMSRPRLLRLLDSDRGRALTLVRAPAGFGKTTLLSEWADRHDPAPSWLALDEGDNDPVRFWTHFIAAVRVREPGLGKAALEMLGSFPGRPLQACLTVLINELCSVRAPHTFILDDYHAI
jgi:LuxR family maltose regulon positive regulatory protein